MALTIQSAASLAAADALFVAMPANSELMVMYVDGSNHALAYGTRGGFGAATITRGASVDHLLDSVVVTADDKIELQADGATKVTITRDQLADALGTKLPSALTLSDSVTSDSVTDVATSKAVKTVMDVVNNLPTAPVGGNQFIGHFPSYDDLVLGGGVPAELSFAYVNLEGFLPTRFTYTGGSWVSDIPDPIKVSTQGISVGDHVLLGKRAGIPTNTEVSTHVVKRGTKISLDSSGFMEMYITQNLHAYFRGYLPSSTYEKIHLHMEDGGYNGVKQIDIRNSGLPNNGSWGLDYFDVAHHNANGHGLTRVTLSPANVGLSTVIQWLPCYILEFFDLNDAVNDSELRYLLRVTTHYQSDDVDFNTAQGVTS